MQGNDRHDVVVIGCGPVGAYLANLLGRAGLNVLILDRETSPYALPRAVHIDHEMARLLANIGLWDQLEPLMSDADGHIHIGADGGMIRYLSARNKARPFGYSNDYFFHQPEMETALREALGRYPGVEMMLGAEALRIVEDGDMVRVCLADGQEFRTRWLVGADGARSIVRKSAGIALDDMNFEETWLVVDAEVDGPIRFPDFHGVPDGANLQRLSLMLCDPRRPSTIVPGRGKHRRWEFMLLPGEDEAAMARPDAVANLVAPWIGEVPHQILRAATYQFHGLVVHDWRRGRMLLAGDAAHQTPPFFGQGLCHGLRDAANLAWKLALVVQGASDVLLDTYQAERDPQVRHVVRTAIETGRYICELDPEKAAQRDTRMRNLKGPATAAELILPIASRLIAEGPGAGQRFINPPVMDTSGQAGLLDDMTGGGWALILRDGAAMPDDARLSRIGARVVVAGRDFDEREGHLANWFERHGAMAVLLRPDFYVAAAPADTAALADALDRLAAELAPVA